jgi:hypothetical protein
LYRLIPAVGYPEFFQDDVSGQLFEYAGFLAEVAFQVKEKGKQTFIKRHAAGYLCEFAFLHCDGQGSRFPENAALKGQFNIRIRHKPFCLIKKN